MFVFYNVCSIYATPLCIIAIMSEPRSIGKKWSQAQVNSESRKHLAESKRYSVSDLRVKFLSELIHCKKELLISPTVGPTNPTFHNFATIPYFFITTCKTQFSRFVFLTLTFGFNISTSNSDPNADFWSRIHIRFYHSSRNNSYSNVPVSFSQIRLCKMF